MSMDMWLIKMKDKNKWNLDCGECEYWNKYKKSIPKGDNYCDDKCKIKCAWWNDTNEDIENIIPKENKYLNGWQCWGEEEYYLINTVISNEYNVKIKFYGDPICKQENFDFAVEMLNKWFKEKWNGETEFKVNENWTIKIDNVEDFVEYMNIAKENRFTMWFSF